MRVRNYHFGFTEDCGSIKPLKAIFSLVIVILSASTFFRISTAVPPAGILKLSQLDDVSLTLIFEVLFATESLLHNKQAILNT